MSTIIQGAKPTKPAEAQLESLRQMVKILDLVYGIEIVGGHRDFEIHGFCLKGMEILGLV